MARKEIKTRALKNSPITIIGEGLTEQYYFTHIRSLQHYHYTIKPYFFGTTSLKDMDRKINEVIENGGIAVAVFDADVADRNEAEMKKLQALRKKFSRKKNVLLCDSLPSIEYWFLLHYANTNKFFKDSYHVEKELRKYISEYEKRITFLEKEKWVADLCKDGKLPNAIERAKSFGITGDSYSRIYAIFELLNTNISE